MRLRILAAVGVLALAFSGQAMATVYSEVGDAGQTMGTAQSTGGSGALNAITGQLGSWSDADMFLIHADGGAFSANTLGSGIYDPMLHLYNLLGNRVLFNDDWYGLQSYIHSDSLQEGNYYLAISYFSNGYTYGNASSWTEGSYAGVNPYTINLQGATAAEPVPEPSTFLLLGAGLAGIGFMRRRAKG